MRLAVSAAAVAAVLGGLSLVQAQGAGQSSQAARPKVPAAPKRVWYSINLVTVKSDSLTEFIEFQKSQTIPMLQRGGVKVRDTWQGGAPFGDSNTFVFVTAIDKFADYDLEPRVLRVLGADPGRS